ncbi:ATP-binding cassette domain-containing protein [Metamycoplasma hyosynoviae]|uniref:ATP-binding cassette domain-containing protein n=1 Tax=Metamycoplasma hyosynoviae TaxID=29559 RepID=UPI002360B209|nr:ATP-binding cassette domain-containing protein [Metamycoplasma hyosynoviae]MDD1359278.1 ATP-binding cassette domain-containing protein [Metamycoplasma hyosynoviae]MDD1377550.1 ATP-binding cassette domain-containing protein [Metamycoplasma hyosynoviae]MDD7907789.1 ATP-binding cassette domain-containing protein [Metamycoplasma hyosynoviae]
MQIKVNNISKEYNKGLPSYIKVLEDISLSIKEGERISIIGPTGSGKTTLIETLNGLILPDTGNIDFIDVPLKKKIKLGSKPKLSKLPSTEEIEEYNKKLQEWNNEKARLKALSRKDRFEIIYANIQIHKTKRKIKNMKAIRKQVGVVFQFAEYQLFESTIEKDIIFGPISMGIKKEVAKENAKKYIKIVGLTEEYLKRSPFNLSGGQKRRIALAGILAMEPKFLILDEPTAGLDPNGVEEMLSLFHKINQETNTTIIIVTHDLDNALRWTNRTLFVKDGKIIYDGDTYNVLNDEKFLRENNLVPTKLLSFVNKLKAKGFDLGKVNSLDELADKLNNIISKKQDKPKTNNRNK